MMCAPLAVESSIKQEAFLDKVRLPRCHRLAHEHSACTSHAATYQHALLTTAIAKLSAESKV